jgi:peroxiredoxin
MDNMTDQAVGNAPPVGVGDPAPDVTVAGADGQPVQLAELWRRGPTVLVFTRQLG